MEEPPEMEGRVSLLREGCLKEGLEGGKTTPSKFQLRPIVRVESLGLSWCLVPKVASSSISSILLPYLPSHHTDGVGKDKDYAFVQEELWERAGRLRAKPTGP